MEEFAQQEFLKKFGQHLKELRVARGLSFRDLASRCSVEYSRIHTIEKGQANIEMLTLLDLASGLGVKPKELLNF